MIHVPKATVERIRREAAGTYPEECCGALLGREDDEGRGRVVRALPGRNERAAGRERRYLLSPDIVRTFEREAERTGHDVIGFFHSHPDAPAVPSEFDRRHAWPWYRYVIVGVEGGRPGTLRCWRLRADRSGFDEVPVVRVEPTIPATRRDA